MDRLEYQRQQTEHSSATRDVVFNFIEGVGILALLLFMHKKTGSYIPLVFYGIGFAFLAQYTLNNILYLIYLALERIFNSRGHGKIHTIVYWFLFCVLSISLNNIIDRFVDVMIRQFD
ncbi:hypothetical protein HNR47_002971 [Methylopila jiangsuensis]|uniref:hypothetical protein n=1 Tax=Methylopila jiangsuensis TaxID=586230 RepID=UPI0022F2F097|nr:hypothetical protein [Methylopila jiangsuensis]MDR6286950.1 hypothetical protein [Methylopila jiangsuensis]